MNFNKAISIDRPLRGLLDVIDELGNSVSEDPSQRKNDDLAVVKLLYSELFPGEPDIKIKACLNKTFKQEKAHHRPSVYQTT